MMGKAPPKGLAIILAGAKKPVGAPPTSTGSSSPAPEESDEMGGDLEAAAQDVLNAVAAKDAQALAEALQSFVTMAKE